MTVVSSSPLRGPVQTDERALAPDLARGLMLLLIALANTPWYLYAAEVGSSWIHPRDGSFLDAVVQFVIITTVDMRVYPMFAFLFGYGMAQLFRRQTEAGTPEKLARRILRRRNWWLLAFGFVHAALLFGGDVLGAYGLAGLVMVALFFRRRDRTLLVWSVLGISLLTLATASAIVGSVFAARAGTGGAAEFLAAERALAGEQRYLDSILPRLESWPLLVFLQGLLTLVIPVALLLSFWAARRQVLEQPGDHLKLLKRTAGWGIGIGWLGGIPNALSHLDILAVPDQVSWVFLATQSSTGLLGGIGYVAAFALCAHRIARRAADRASRPVEVITAVGRRSLSCYLAQSVLCAPILSGWGLGLGAHLTSATMALFAIAVWLLTAVLADALERRRMRGPAEVLLRRLVYGRR